jgi:Cu(I)/Ag(I) efflux system membrane fusion protein/cobalt-zinc-cadmium efflux system membrane fusion protein
MDPNFVSDKPGKSPMGMDLVPVYGEESEPATGHVIRIDPVTIQNMGIRTAALRRGPLIKTIRTIGRVDYDEQRVTFINTKFEGWIEKLHVNETGQYVEQGQPLFDVYSRELYTAQEEYQAAHRAVGRLADSTLPSAKEEALRMLEAAVTKLRYLDVSDAQIANLSATDEIQKNIAIHSPDRGVVTEKMALQGMFVKPGMRLYTIADLSRVWVYVDIYEYQLPWIRIGQRAEMRLAYIPGKDFEGKVVYVYPYLEKKTRVVKVRLEFDNPSMELKPDMFANITLFAELKRDALLIPREAYIDSGTRQVAFVALEGGKFQPRDIQVGVEAEDGMVEVLYGLDAGEVVVTSGQFMLDSEAKLKESLAKMMEAERAQTTKHAPPSEADEHAHAAAGIPEDARYACPMDRHPDETEPDKQGAYFSAEAGKCPSCGMSYKPLEELAWVKARRAAAGAEVAYTCPDHPHVFTKSADACPRCGKDMAPFKVMYTCPNAGHSSVISSGASNCPHSCIARSKAIARSAACRSNRSLPLPSSSRSPPVPSTLARCRSAMCSQQNPSAATCAA